MVGIGVLLWLLVQNSSPLVLAIVGVGIWLNAYSIYAGNQLMNRQNVRPTYIIQAIQILNFVGLGVSFQIVIGASVGFGLDWVEEALLGFNFDLLSAFEFKYKPSQMDAIRVVVNFVPIFIINYLMKRKSAAEERKYLAEYSSDNVTLPGN